MSPVLKTTLEGTQKILAVVDENLVTVEQYQKKVRERLETYKSVQSNIQENIQKVDELQHLVEYFRVLKDIQDISTELTHCIHSKDEQKIVTLFLSLSGSPESTDSVIGRLQDVDAPHMKLYTRRMAFYWHDIIRDKLSR